MIVSELCGGLGNQMFQYAAGRALAVKHDVPFALDLSKYSNCDEQNGDTRRYFELDCFAISADQASTDQVVFLKSNKETRIKKLFKFIFNKHHPLYSGFFQEPHFQYTSKFKKISGDAYLSGFWQSEKYFFDIAALIRKEFSLKEKWQADLLPLRAQVASCSSISLHVRRGDYISNAEINDYHGTCSEKYYENAINHILKRIHDAVFFIFSDDIDWVKQNIDTGTKTVWVNEGGTNRACEDMILMSCCKHHIIANSSFSWWGAWLNSRSDKIVLCPQQWFVGAAHDTKDLLPDSWIQL